VALKLALDLDGVLGDTRRLWADWLDDAARRFRSIAELDLESLPADRARAAEELDRWANRGIGDWRIALERFAEDRAPVYLRPDAEISARLRELAGAGALDPAARGGSRPPRRGGFDLLSHRGAPAGRQRRPRSEAVARRRCRPGGDRNDGLRSRDAPPRATCLAAEVG